VLPELVAAAERDQERRFDLLKERISAAYYSSEKGMKQLGFTGQMAHGGFPGCTHPGGHASSD
jgi:hypothetical protein